MCFSALTLILTASAQIALAQQVVSFPTPTPVGVGETLTDISISLPNGGAISAIEALTQGSPGVDYAVSGGSCSVGSSYLAGGSCTVNITFKPKSPGLRQGAAVLLRSDHTAIGTVFLTGNGIGALGVLIPGVINTVAGDAYWNYSGDNQPATQSALFLPRGVVMDGADNLYIADTNNNRVRKVDAAQNITTVAGSSTAGYAGDGGPGTAAEIYNPTGLAMDGAGNLYIADSGNHVIRMLNTLSGVITTIAGSGLPGSSGDGGPAINATFSVVNDLKLDTQQRLYIADTGNQVIRQINLSTGIIARFAGTTGTAGSSGNGGQALDATFNSPQGVAFGPDGSMYVADLYNNLIRKIAPSGVVSIVAGGSTGAIGDGGPATAARLSLPAAVAVDQAGNLFIADSAENLIRKVNAVTNLIETVAGSGSELMTGDGQNANLAGLYGPYSIYYDGKGNLFIGDLFHNRIRKVSGTPATLQYQPMRVNAVSAPMIELIEDDGNADLLLSTPNLINALLDPATTTCALPQTLTTGISCKLGVDFAPTTIGTLVTGQVNLPSNAVITPAIIDLSGQVLLVYPTAVTLTSSLNPSGFGTAVTFSSHVTTQGTTVTGTVQFFDGSVSLKIVNLTSADSASMTTSNLALGLHTITAVYSGDSANAGSTSIALTQGVKQAAAMTLTSSQANALVSTPLILTAQLRAVGTTPSGQVVFTDAAVTLGTGTIDANGIATLTISTLAIGQHTLTASYPGDSNTGASQATLIQVIKGQTSTVALSTSNPTVPVGTSVTFSVQVTGDNAAIPTGTVIFKDGATTLNSAVLSGSGTASISLTTLTSGVHSITAIYQGDTNYAGSSSAPLTETVQQIGTVVALSFSVNPAAAGATIVLTATISSSSSNAVSGPITGPVTFFNGSVKVGTGTAVAGVATLSIATLPLGPNTITAFYAGSPNYSENASPSAILTVVQATSATLLATSLTPSIVESPITLTATVSTNGGQATGTVTFSDSGVTIGQGVLNTQGTATALITGLLVGQHTLTASYAGDTQDLGSVSAGLIETISLHPSTDLLTSSATSLTGGQQVTLISIVGWTGAIIPTGTVTFVSGGTTLGNSPVNSSGVATLTINPQTGLTNISSTYNGDSVFSPSSSSILSITVGAPEDFTLSTSATAITVKTLQHTSVSLTATSEQGFTDQLLLGCLGLPKAVTCTFTADSVALAANGTSTVNIVIDTGSPLLAGSVARNDGLQTAPSTPPSLLALCGLPVGAIFTLVFWRRRQTIGRLRALGGLLLLLCALGAMAGLSGCGTAITTNGTVPGVYKFQITAAAQGASIIQAVNMTLTVTP